LTGICAAVLLSGCTSGAALGSSGTVTLTTAGAGNSAGPAIPATTSTSVTPTPVTPNGLLTGAGVDDTSITLGMLVDSRLDRGFSSGVELWLNTVETSGGICGRMIRTATQTPTEPMAEGYARVAGSTLGLITRAGQSDSLRLSALSTADQVPILTLTGSSAELRKTGPVVIAATEDIKAINALAYLRSTGKLPAGSILGTLTDSSADAANALAGATWWAARNEVTLVGRSTGTSDVHAPWTSVAAVLVSADPAHVTEGKRE